VSRLLLPFPGCDAFAARLVARGAGRLVVAQLRSFPDGETHVRLRDDVTGGDVAIVASLDRPDEKLARLLLLAATARDLGARRVGLVAPYLAYLRQDARFEPGDGITSVYFARLLSAAFDWLVTVDPHLHRWPTLAAIYSIPTSVAPAAPAIAAWIRAEVAGPLVIGPDAESEPWARGVAAAAGAPHAVASKVRHGDRDVEVELPDLARWRGRTPVIVDDIASTARTQAAVVRRLRSDGWAPPVCIAVHALFSGDAEATLRAAGAGRIATCDTVVHPTNAIDVSGAVAAALVARPIAPPAGG